MALRDILHMLNRHAAFGGKGRARPDGSVANDPKETWGEPATQSPRQRAVVCQCPSALSRNWPRVFAANALAPLERALDR
jgi:hypothetical protein